MSNNNNSSGGIGFLGLLAIVFIVLKLTGHIDCSWWWVTCPLWGPAAISLIVVIVAYIHGRLTIRKKIEKAGLNYDEFRKRLNQPTKSKWQERMERMQEEQKLREKK